MHSCWVILGLFTACAFAAPVPAFIDLPFRHAGPMRIDSLGRSQNGAVNEILLGPNRVAYSASVSGGVWRTEDISVDSPRWRPLTDDLDCSFFRDIALDATNSSEMICATCGDYSSYLAGTCALRHISSLSSTETRLTPGFSALRTAEKVGQSVEIFTPPCSSLTLLSYPYLVVSVNNDEPSLETSTFPKGGVFISSNNGASWTQALSGQFTDIVGLRRTSPASTILYAGNPYEGIFKSDDMGESWENITPANFSAEAASHLSCRFTHGSGMRLALFDNGRRATLYSLLIVCSQLVYIWRYDIDTNTWTEIPFPSEGNMGLFPLGQGDLHNSIAVHPKDPNIVLVGGDTTFDWPFRARVFAWNSTTWTYLSGNNITTECAHSDSRHMIFDPTGTYLYYSSDGGMFRARWTPPLSNLSWSYLGGNISVTEIIFAAYNPISRRPFGGSQDNGTPVMLNSNGDAEDITTGDGQTVAISTFSYPSFVSMYSSTQRFGFDCSREHGPCSFCRGRFEAATQNITEQHCACPRLHNQTVLDLCFSWAPVFELNTVTPKRVALIDNDTLHESLNAGKTYVPVLSLLEPITSTRFAYGARRSDGAVLEHWTLIASVNKIYGRLSASMDEPLQLLVTMYPEYAVHAITLATNQDPATAFLLVHAHPSVPEDESSTSSTGESTSSSSSAYSYYSSSTGEYFSSSSSVSGSSSTGMPWSSSSGSAIHHARRRRGGPRHREGEEEEDDEERLDSDGKRKPSTYLSPREYSIWTLDTQSLLLTDVTGNLPLRVEAWTSPYFQATSIVAVSLQDKDTAVVIGGTNGVWRMLMSQPGQWSAVDPFPACVVRALHYSLEADVLTVGTQGRGFWTLEQASNALQLSPPTPTPLSTATATASTAAAVLASGAATSAAASAGASATTSLRASISTALATAATATTGEPVVPFLSLRSITFLQLVVAVLALLIVALISAVVWMLRRRTNGREFAPVSEEIEMKEYSGDNDGDDDLSPAH